MSPPAHSCTAKIFAPAIFVVDIALLRVSALLARFGPSLCLRAFRRNTAVSQSGRQAGRQAVSRSVSQYVVCVQAGVGDISGPNRSAPLAGRGSFVDLASTPHQVLVRLWAAMHANNQTQKRDRQREKEKEKDRDKGKERTLQNNILCRTYGLGPHHQVLAIRVCPENHIDIIHFAPHNSVAPLEILRRRVGVRDVAYLR